MTIIYFSHYCRLSLMVDDYLAFPECAISCVSVLNSVCFKCRHSLAKTPDLPLLLIRGESEENVYYNLVLLKFTLFTQTDLEEFNFLSVLVWKSNIT